jgi:uncharacterized membrane protein YhaH (DUF805 family)
MNWQSLFFKFRGPINRAKFWLASLIFFGVGILLGLIGIVAGNSMVFEGFDALVNLAMFVSGLAVAAKRLHDRDKSAWWLVLFYFGPAVFIVIAVGITWDAAGAAGMTADVALLLLKLCIIGGIAIGIWGFVEIGCLRGTAGYNRFGPDPLPRRLPQT